MLFTQNINYYDKGGESFADIRIEDFVFHCRISGIDNIGDAENVFFAEGLTEEIISRVSRIQNLRVIPRTDVKKYRSSTLGSSEISNELQVNYLLEGTVRKSNNKIRVTTNLIKSRDKSIIWNGTFDTRGIS